MRMHFSGVALMVLFSQSSLALPGIWNDTAKNIVSNYKAHAKIFSKDKFQISAWGSIQAKKAYGLAVTPAGLFHHKVPSRAFERGEFEILLHAACNLPLGCNYPIVGEHLIKKAPLIVFSPGIFNEPTDSQSLRGLELYSNRGFHVAVVPNSFSTSYISYQPKFRPGDLVEEAKVLQDVIREAQKALGADKIESVNLIGDSYGGFISVVAAAFDNPAMPLITGSVSVFSPPLDFMKTVNNLDAAYLGWAPEVATSFVGGKIIGSVTYNDVPEGILKLRQRCSEAMIQMGAVFDYFVKSKSSAMSDDSRECAEYLVGGPGFQKWLVVAGKALASSGALSEDPRYPFNEGFLFRDYLNVYAPELLEKYGPNNEQRKLVYWIKRARLQGFKKIRIVSSQDDFINDPGDWREVSSMLSTSRQLVLLPAGGHLGLIAMDWIERFLDLNFAPRIWGTPLSELQLPGF